MNEITGLIPDNGHEEGSLEVTVIIGDGGIEIKTSGYGHPSETDGSPMFIELYNGELVLHVWDDINKQDPRTISLEGAREENYEPTDAEIMAGYGQVTDD
jgi:hypothetical protein